MRAQSSYQAGSVTLQTKDIPSISSSVAAPRLSVLPSFSCEVTGFSPSVSVQIFDEALLAEGKVGYHKYERKAMLKFKRNLQVLPGMLALKKISIDGYLVQPERYEPLLGQSPSEYDTSSSKDDADAFDQFSLKAVLKDYVHTDPATRYLIAKNRFERALHDAKVILPIFSSKNSLLIPDLMIAGF